MEDFAKVFKSEKYGQIIVMSDSDDDTGGEVLKIYAKPPNCYPCVVKLEFDTEEKKDAAFEKVTLEIAEQYASEVFKSMETFYE